MRYDNEQLISAHLYQVYAYVQNWQAAHPHAPLCRGMLLYPTVTKELDLNYQISGHNISVKTINLNQPCHALRPAILQLVQ